MLKVINVGNGSDCQIRIDEIGIAEHHASLFLNDGMVSIELSPGCSAVLNGNMVEGRYWLQPDDKICIGTKRLNLLVIKDVLEGRDNGFGEAAFFSDDDDPEDNFSDAVIVKKNPWPAIIIAIVIIIVGIFTFKMTMRYHEHKNRIKQEILMRQDSIRQAETTIDSLNNLIMEINN